MIFLDAVAPTIGEGDKEIIWPIIFFVILIIIVVGLLLKRGKKDKK